MRGISVCGFLAAALSVAFGQKFEVVSVKPNKSLSNGSSTNTNQGRLTATNVTLRSLIVMAYGVKDYQVEGPDWLTSERFDITGKFPQALPRDREKYNAGLHAMMQDMLTDRFRLAVHRETKVFSVYELILGKSGIKFKEVPDTDSHNQSSNNNHYKGTCVSMNAFAEFLSRRADLPVLDMTGLKGFYDLTLDWSLEPRQAGVASSNAPVPATDIASKPAIYEALQEQLGLKLETRKAPIQVLVVDHAERVPTEN